MNSSKIHILSDHIINKIAAGEVVDRPASVVKELLENAIDSGAGNIELYIKRAGKVLVQVIDDGCGMSEEDALLSIQRHTTSKIESFEDLEKLNTFGFRGEALSSISAVSILEIKTETKDSEFGTLLRKDDEKELVIEKGSFPKGTSISVQNLFYNVPARRNFLKSNATELKHIINAFNRIALANCKISFKFWNENDLIFNYQSSDVESRIKSVVADNILDVVVKAEEKTEYISVEGYIAKPNLLKKSKNEQYLFINKRFVKSRSINHAVFSAYQHLLAKGDYPFYVLYLTLDPSQIDVNVHPTKLEVKFEDEKGIYNFLLTVLKKSLGSFDLVPSLHFTEDVNKEKLRFIDFSRKEMHKNPSKKSSFSDGSNMSKSVFDEKEIDLLFGTINKEMKDVSPKSEISHPFDDEKEEVEHNSSFAAQEESVGTNSSFIVSLHNKYILAQIRSGLMVIDQHVAHERILYEKAVNSLLTDMPFSQQLLFSQTVKVDPGEYELLKELEPNLIKLGFDLKFFGNNTIVIDGVPSDVKMGTEIDTLLGLLREYIKNNREQKLEVTDNIAKSYSCKTAIKAGDNLTEIEMRQLVDQLFATSMPYACPHGRPIVVKILLDEFDKRFGRS